jgi:signal transduction histidine kinase
VDGQAVGYALAIGSAPPLDPREERYLARTNQALFLAGLAATLVALLLGILLARSLTRPLGELTAAIRRMAGGQLEQQVRVRSSDEVGQLAVAFNQMSADLARSNQARRQMTADIAHDLRTPLTVIAGYAESLRDGVLKPTPDRFDVIYTETQHLQRLVEDLRILSLADAGELRLNRQPLMVDGLLLRVVSAYAQQANQAGIELQVDCPPDLPPVVADEERLAQALGNLVSNALRHTPDGGRITLGARRQADGLQLRVQDTGEGIPPEALPMIFERFYRVDAARQGSESGLGLAIVRSLVDAHGGSVQVESQMGRGACFMITLPARPGR